MAAIILLGTFGGIKLDALIKWSFPVFTVGLSLLSVIFAMYFMLKDLMRKKK
ncbi:MAG: AtpZ/AtpI family protein [Bacteroidales bacterium]|nr:AtpZ/AtpI family protein [Bacteroidales bacterium]